MKNRYIFTGNRTLARQRGAVGILGALVLALGVLFMAVSVDSGRLFVEQRRLQKVADMAALDASNSAGSCGNGAVATAQAAAQGAAGHNGFLGNLLANVGSVSEALDGLPGAGPGAVTEVGTIALGAVRTVNGIRTFDPTAPAEAAGAVQVTAASRVPASLVAGGILGETVDLSAVAVADRQAVAGLSAGSFLARVNPQLNPLLNGLLGAGLSVDLLSYQGIAAADVTLRGLIEAHGGVGTVNELLALNTDVADFLALTADALSNQGDAAAAATLNLIANSIPSPDAFTLGDLLKVTSEDPDTALDAKVNVMDLLMGSAQVAHGNHAVTLAVAIPGVTSVRLWLIEPPQIAIGPPGKNADGNWKTQVKTAQMRLSVDVRLPLPNINVGLASITFDALGLVVEAAPTTAALASINCPRYTAPEGQVTVSAHPGIAGLALGRLDAAGRVIGASHVARVSLRVPLLGTVPVADIGAAAAINVASPAGQSLEFDGPFPSVVKTVGTPLGPALAGALADLTRNLRLTVTVVGLPLGALLNPVLGAISGALGPVVATLGNTLLTPLLSALGVTLGGADIQVFTLDVKPPRLRI